MEFINLAIKIRANIIALVMNEKYVPKRWRPSEYETRLQAQNKAIADCETLLDLLQFMVDMKPTQIAKLAPFAEDITKEILLLRGWRLADNKRFKQYIG